MPALDVPVRYRVVYLSGTYHEGDMTFGDLVKAHRRARGLSRAELAELVGVSRPTIARIESSERRPSVPLLGKLVQSLELDPSVALSLASVAA